MKYMTKPVIKEAFQYNGELRDAEGNCCFPDWALEAFKNGIIYFGLLNLDQPSCELFIKTLEGTHHVSVGDYIIRGIKGELYPCKPDIFEATYEPCSQLSPLHK